MITVDKQAYPIVVIYSEGEVTLGDVQSFSRTLESIFARETPCGVIMISEEYSVTAPEARSTQARWMKQRKPRIAEICRGFAWVLISPVQLVIYKPMMALQGKRMMGCPVAAFGDIESAKSWIQKQLTSS